MTSIREFPDWYKRRINRIYPTVLAIAIIKCTFFGSDATINKIILHGGGWFVSCIMIYYVFIFLIGLYARKHINLIIVLVSLASCVWFFTLERPFPFNMYGLRLADIHQHEVSSARCWASPASMPSISPA